jgi:hypothetical protein
MLPPESLSLRSLSTAQRAELLAWLGDSPFTALNAGQLQVGLCRAYAVGDPKSPAAALVHSASQPTEPAAFGKSAAPIWALLSRVPGWNCVEVDSGIAGEVATLLEVEVGMPTRRLACRYYALERDPVVSQIPSVRRLGPKDVEMVRRSDPLFKSFFLGHGNEDQTLSDGVVAGVTAEGELVSAVTTSAWAGLHVDLGAATIPAMRRRGLATGAAFVVCSELRARGLVPVWAAGEPNQASWRIPEKLGFRYVGNREYVVVDGLKPSGFRPRPTHLVS